jgi:hypothetical protein
MKGLKVPDNNHRRQRRHNRRQNAEIGCFPTVKVD